MQKSFLYEGTHVNYLAEGAGFPVVLLHGFAEDSSIWEKQINYLKENFYLIVPDLPGSGKSGTLPGEDLTIEDFAHLIFALLQSENISKCVLLGHSMGGYIALAFAEKYSFMLNAFGFVHSTAYADNEEKKANRKKGIDLMERFGAHAFIKNTTPNLFSAEFKEQHREQVETLIERGKQFSKESLQKYYRAMMNRPDRTHVLTSSTVPVLFILGTEDIAAPMNDLLQQVQLPEVAYIYILKDAGHMGMWESSLKVNEGLLYFLSDVL